MARTATIYRGYTILLVDAEPGSISHTEGVKAVIDHGHEQESFHSLAYAKEAIDRYCEYDAESK